MKLRAIATKSSFGLYDETGTRIATMNNTQIYQESRAQTIAHRVNCFYDLVEALGAIIDNEEHATSCGAREYQKGSPTWEIYEAGRLALERAKLCP